MSEAAQQQKQSNTSSSFLSTNTSEKGENTALTLDSNKDVFENILLTLKSLQQQNTRLAKFQQDSYKFHLQHHSNIKKIISGLNLLSENFERMGMSSFELKPEEDQELMQRCAPSELSQSQNHPAQQPKDSFSSAIDFKRSMQLALHDKIVQHSNSLHEVDTILRGVNDIETFKQLKPVSLSLILPVMESWLREIDDARMSLVFMYEGARLFPDVFSHKDNRPIILRMIKTLESWSQEDVEKIDFEANCVRELYQFLISSCSE